MAQYKGMVPENMYRYDEAFQVRAEDSRRDSPIFTAPGELEVMHTIQRTESHDAKKPLTMIMAMQRYTEERRRQLAEGSLILRETVNS